MTRGVWSKSELEFLAIAYACMLGHQRRREPYVKAQHNRWLQGRIGRSAGSIEFKLANVSAALDEAGLEFIRGYLPRGNRQGELDALVSEGIERFAPTVCPCA